MTELCGFSFEQLATFHSVKLSNLKSHPPIDVSMLDTDKIVVNLSNTEFSNTEVNILSRGLSYSTPPQYLNSLDALMCHTYIYRYQSHMFHNLPKEEFQAFQRLKKKHDIVFCKLDKGNVVNKTDYNQKIKALINDKSKCKQLKEDPNREKRAMSAKVLKVS